MDVDQDNINKYDEYVRRPAREVITVETPLKASNKGFAMLAKLGWVEGQPLGISGEGRVDPIPFQMKADSTGLGKVRQDVEMIETTVSQRRGLDSERQQKETEDQRRAREDAVARKSAVAEEISDVLKAFYCSLCDKQFKNVAQYDEHTNSYAHHHKARFKDMQASSRIKPQEEIEKRKEKEQKREEKQLRKIAAASGVKMAKTTLPPSGAPVLAPVANVTSGFQPSGWASVSGSGDSTLSSSSGGFKKAGWASVGPSSSPETLAPVSDSVTTTSSGGLKKAGWTTVGSTFPSTAQAVPPASASSGSWKIVTPSSGSSLDASSLPSNVPTPSAASSTAVEPVSQPAPQHPPSKSHLSRVGWQQFQKKNKKV
ncbi:MAG: G-patch-domain Zn-finger DNA-binding protein [Lentinula lateritia]|nr:MAG: G-patch-domain Zn-finger DNA-binding protein [Lentinula lateritia]